MRTLRYAYRPMPAAGYPRVGTVFGDIVEYGEKAVETIADALSSIPGGDWIVDAVSSGADWLGEYAKTGVGQFVLASISGSLAAWMLPVTGPFVASMMIAAPGVVAGEPFTDALLHGYEERSKQFVEFWKGAGIGYAIEKTEESVKQTAEYIATSTQALLENPDFQARLGAPVLQDQLHALAWTPDVAQRAEEILTHFNANARQIMRDFNVREDVAAGAISAYVRLPAPPPGANAAPALVYDLTEFGVETGRRAATGAVGRFDSRVVRASSAALPPTIRDRLASIYGPNVPAHIVRAAEEGLAYRQRANVDIMAPGGFLSRGETGAVAAVVGLALLTSPLWAPRIIERFRR